MAPGNANMVRLICSQFDEFGYALWGVNGRCLLRSRGTIGDTGVMYSDDPDNTDDVVWYGRQ